MLIYTVITEEGVCLIDSATYPSDIDTYVIPALSLLGIGDDRVKYLCLTHSHSDHKGGFDRLCERYPKGVPAASFNIKGREKALLLYDKDLLLSHIEAVLLPGHTKDALAYFDKRSKTLLSGDCIQLAGVGKYTHGVVFRSEYISSMERLKDMDIETVVAAHEYEPLGSIARGKDKVLEYLDTAIALA